ncbi:MAG: hypothetical protein KDA27_20300 [Candidatus Eisenbacteria bacterium]|uniref:Uncharacterized protein n=1 Tax=Eiseniibacteriota bacterium TaxID=2212470 RepID=A0A956NEZ2_UNCEI|nr:hypothetical protein [Candidatus Eisenbacteria bacterium]MCB9466350.1 hypothetical protein [Candidatus Eisenbacteria bacterium]
MSALVIWGEDDHERRGRALATTYATTAQKISVKPTKMPGLATLVFWGHGDPSAFCGLPSKDFVDLVGAWRKLNGDLKTVEMLTCNARHKQYGFPDSYTKQVVDQLGKKQAGIKFKALPVAVGPSGKTADYSILKWHPASATWAYIGAPGDFPQQGSSTTMDKHMHAADVKLGDFMPPRGDNVGYVRAHAAMKAFQGMTVTHPYAIKRKWDQKQVDVYNEELKLVKRDAFIMAGTIGLLRWCLTEIN